jgi:flagellar assembly factor FliW
MFMTHHAINLSMPPLMDIETNQTIHSRFGDLVVDTRNTIMFSRGLLGMPDKQHYVLCNFPNEKMQQFKLLQSLDDKALSFITLPLDIDNPIIEKNDVLMGCQALSIPLDDLALLLVVSVYRTPETTRITANARAPLFLDAEKKWGVQHVFPNSKYKVQHVIKE